MYMEKRSRKMAILKPIQKTEMKSISAKIPEYLKTDIGEYCKYANLNGLQDFIIQASTYILAKDKEFLKYKQTKSKAVDKTENN